MKVADVLEAEKLVLRMTQKKYMSAEVEVLSRTSSDPKDRQARREVKKVSSLAKLDPFLNKDGLICVGGRLRETEEKCPVVIPKRTNTSILIIREAHQEVAHCGRCITLNKIRDNGYWVIGAHSAVRGYIDRCRTCRELRGKVSEQKMADLPDERVTPSPPFTHCGCDMVGPFIIKEGRKELKRYGCLFTCMSSRAVHIECTSDLSADTFIQALRRFIGRRGKVTSIRSDNGTNFVGAEKELQKCLEEMDDSKVHEFLLSEGCDWISWKKNPPSASHMGGVWERQIRSIRTILTALMKRHSAILNDESFRTLMVEAEAIINSRPLTVENLSDPAGPAPLSPIQLLTFKSNVIFPPPGDFARNDLYVRRHYRRVQFLANQFWSRWRTEYLSSLQERQKWGSERRNLCVGDVVLIKDSEVFTKRNGWPIARVEEVFPSDDGLVRKVKLKVGNKQADKSCYLVRPVAKLVLLVECDADCS